MIWTWCRPIGFGRCGERVLNTTAAKPSTVWEELLPLGNHPDFIAMGAYAVLKLALVSGSDPYLGPWNYYRQLGLALIDRNGPATHDYCYPAFVVLFLTKGLRPAFPTEAGK